MIHKILYQLDHQNYKSVLSLSGRSLARRTMSAIACLNASSPRGSRATRTSKSIAPSAIHLPRRAFPRRGVDVTPRAAVDASVAYAVAQQDLFFAALVAVEAVYQQGNLPADFKGRPELPNIAVPCGLLVGSFALIQSDAAIVSQLDSYWAPSVAPRRGSISLRGTTPSTTTAWTGRDRIFPGTDSFSPSSSFSPISRRSRAS